MECSCECDWGDPADVYDVTYRTARKAHECCECGEIIQPRDKYQRVFGIWEGEMYTFKTCLSCSRMVKDYCAPHGGLREHIQECLGTDPFTGSLMWGEDENE